MKLTVVVSIIICCTACRSAAVHSIPFGEYAVKGKDYEIYLDLRPDSSFTYKEKNMEVLSEAKGKWKYNSADTIYLIRDTVVPLSETLSSGYMKGVPGKVVIENRNEVKIGANTLKRKQQ